MSAYEKPVKRKLLGITDYITIGYLMRVTPKLPKDVVLVIHHYWYEMNEKINDDWWEARRLAMAQSDSESVSEESGYSS